MLLEVLRNQPFVLLAPKSKVPIAGERQYVEFETAKKHNGNVGVVCRRPLWVVDIDNPDIAFDAGIMKWLPRTFTVRTAKGKHYYYLDASEENKTFNLKHGGEHYGELRRGDETYVVAPGSIHPSGVEYVVENKTPPVEFSMGEFIAKLGLKKAEPKPWKLRINKDIGFDMFDLVRIPSDARETKHGYQFEHPVHGSTNGQNFSISKDGEVFWCWRCGNGPDEPACGNAARFLALMEGIIHDCSQKLSIKQFKDTMRIAESRGLAKSCSKLTPRTHTKLKL